jgi:hypothetical protein
MRLLARDCNETESSAHSRPVSQHCTTQVNNRQRSEEKIQLESEWVERIVSRKRVSVLVVAVALRLCSEVYIYCGGPREQIFSARSLASNCIFTFVGQLQDSLTSLSLFLQWRCYLIYELLLSAHMRKYEREKVWAREKYERWTIFYFHLKKSLQCWCWL